jgi:CheY-like chemotaxis protein
MRILVVDDDSLNRFLLIHMLEQQGYTDTYEAENGLLAIEQVKRLEPDLILLDVLMPVMDGYEAARQLKVNAGEIYLPIIFITALEDEDSLARCLEAGGDDFVSKPFDKAILAAKIRAHSRTRLLSQKAYEQNKQLSVYRNDVEREHKIVEHIFTNALCIDKYYNRYIDYCLNPATDFNGDLFLVSSSPNGGLYYLIGDFTGHGLASAIGAIPVAQAFQTMAKKGLSLSEMAGTINQILLMLLPGDMFFAAAIVEINHTGKQINVWNGGIPSLLLLCSSGKIVNRFDSLHMSLGILEVDEFESEVERYEAQYGDRLIGFTDGVVELENDKGDMLGETGIEQWLLETPDINVQGIVDKTDEYLAGCERQDDLTIVIYRCQALETQAKNIDASSLPVKITSELNATHLKTTDPVIDFVNIVTNQLGLFGLHSEMFTVLSELYNNALDHGILHLDSKIKESENGFFDYFILRDEKLKKLNDAKIVITIEYAPQDKHLYLQLVDSGVGFKQQEVAEPDNFEKSYGRGISLVKKLCKSIKYSNNGNTVDVVFNI